MTHTTLGLSLIVRDEEARVRAIVKNYAEYFDKIYITVTGKFKTWDNPKIEWSHFKWVNDFSKARNYNLAQIKTAFWFWMDADDEIVSPERIPEVLARMVNDAYDVIYLPYDYAVNDLGETITVHQRERFIRNTDYFRWWGPVHETLIADFPVNQGSADIMRVRHVKTKKESDASHARNHKILMREYKKTPRDPRITMYVGLSLYGSKKWQECLPYLIEHIRTSGSDEDKYKSWTHVAQAHGMLEQYDKAISASMEAAKLLPARPEAYLLLAQYYFDLDNHGKCLEWLKVGLKKEIPEDSLHVFDPTLLGYRSLMLGAVSELNLGNVKEAYALIKKVLQQSPNFPMAKQMLPLFEDVYYETQAVEKFRWLFSYVRDRGGKPAKLLESLPSQLGTDIRLNPERASLTKPKRWSRKSIAFFSAIAPEPWGPDRLDEGIGGSEEAVIYLSRELAQLGWEVTVFCDREEEYLDGNVRWLPWTLLNPRDDFNIFVAWRQPGIANGVKARLVLCDLHDVLPSAQIEKATWIDKFMVKSNYHRSLFNLPDDRFAVIGNGIKKSQFTQSVKKPNTVGYFSSYNRGLECLLNLWPAVRKEIPTAELHIYYGWNSFDAVAKGNPEQMRWKWQMIRKLHELKDMDVTEHGRVSHEELASAMSATQVWAYPTEFLEIHCITALKAQEAGCFPVVTEVAALKETVFSGESVDADDIYTNKAAQAEFTTKLVGAFRDHLKIWPVEDCDWKDVAKRWDEICASVQ